MTFLVLFVLAVVWAVYLVSWARSRTSHRRVNSISSFSNHLSVLERTGPSSVRTPVASRTTSLHGGQYFAPNRPRLSPQKKRRRDVLFGLAGATAFTFLLGLMMGGGAWMLFLLSFAGLVGYVVLLANMQKQKLERRAKVRQLRAAPVPVVTEDFMADFYDEFDEYDEPMPRRRVVGGN